MKQEEVLDYNKLCAEFLGWEYIDKDQHSQAYENYGWWVKRIYHNNIDARNNCNWKGFNQNLKFHSDWNWIMEIIEKILKDYRTDFYLDFDMPVSDTFTVSIGSDGNYNSNGKSIISSKEAVINAINNFLIWYKTKNNVDKNN